MAGNGTSAIPNTGEGVQVGNVSGNTIGGTAPAASNVIAFNTGDGVLVSLVAGTGNAVLGNSIHDNGELGIDLGNDGVTPNDALDADSGPNALQNFPVITTVFSGGGSTTIQGTLNTTPNTNMTIEFFASPSCDPSGNGEGQTFLQSTTQTSDGSGNVVINFAFGSEVPVGQVVTATATDSANNTSEFSACAIVGQEPTPTPTGTATPTPTSTPTNTASPTPTNTSAPAPGPAVPTLSFPMVVLLGLLLAGTGLFLARRQ